MTHNRNKTIYFLLYDSRSGSTLLSQLLQKDPRIAVSLESEFVIDLIKNGMVEFEKGCISDAVDIVVRNPKFSNWKISPSLLKKKMEELSYKTITIYDVLLICMELHFTTLNPSRTIWFFKCGDHIFYMDIIRKYIPNSKFLHILRDGRAVYNSKKKAMNIELNKPMASNPFIASKRWAKFCNISEKYFSEEYFYSITYEQLILDKENCLKGIMAFLKLNPYKGGDRENQAAESDYVSRIPEDQKVLHCNVSSKPIKKRISDWEEKLSPAEIICFQVSCKKELLRTGYTLKKYQLRDLMVNMPHIFVLLGRYFAENIQQKYTWTV